MSANPTQSRLDSYREKLRRLSNEDLVAECGSAILGAAIMSGRRNDTGWADDQTDACYDEAERRGNPDLYQRGYNAACFSQGHTGMGREPTTPIDYREDL